MHLTDHLFEIDILRGSEAHCDIQILALVLRANDSVPESHGSICGTRCSSAARNLSRC